MSKDEREKCFRDEITDVLADHVRSIASDETINDLVSIAVNLHTTTGMSRQKQEHMSDAQNE